jgi:hypothetical protein
VTRRTLRVLVTEGHASAAVAAVRSLGRRGHEVRVSGTRGMFPLAATSRWCRGLVRLPDPLGSPDDYASELLREVRRVGYDAVLPVGDPSLFAAAPARVEVERLATWCAASPPALEAAADKWSLLERAERAGLPRPPGELVEDMHAWHRARARLGRALVHRSRASLLRRGGRLVKPPAATFFDPGAAEQDARGRCERGEPFVVTPFLPGRGRGVYAFVAAGEPRLWFGHERLRETNPVGSPACAAVPSAPNAMEREGCARLLADLSVEGAAMVEFRRDPTGATWIVEVNARLWGSVALAVQAGLDFPWHQVAWFAEREVPVPEAPGRDVPGCRYLSAELSHLRHAWKGRPPGWEGDYPTFRSAFAGFVDGFRQGFGYYHQSSEDPLPGVAEPLAYLLRRG